MTKPLYLDCQLFQTPAWDRGMGKYTQSLLRELSRKNDHESYWESLNLIFTTSLPINQDVASFVNKYVKATKWNLNLSLADPLSNRKEVDKLISNNKAGLDFFIPAIFQKEVYPVFPSPQKGLTKILLSHDLMPLIFDDIFLVSEETKDEYLPRIAELLRADIHLTNSKTTANDLSFHLGLNTEKISSIDGGPIIHSEKTTQLEIKEPYVLMPTGNGYIKNNHNGVLGFKYFNESKNESYRLVITSYFQEHERSELLSLCDKLIFTGNVDGKTMNALFDNASVVLFPSLYEGLGLPILEAVQKRKPVSCSNISVFREISPSAFYFFDPQSTADIGRSLGIAIDIGYDKTEYDKISSRYNWSDTASKFMEALRDAPTTLMSSQKKEILVYGSSVDEEYTIGAHIQKLHSSLSQNFNIRYHTNISERGRSYLPYITKRSSGSIGPTDLVIYHLENEQSCCIALLTALCRPGIVVLHDLILDRAWTALLDQSLIDESRLELEELLDSRLGTKDIKLLGSLVSGQKAIIVHSHYAFIKVKKIIEITGSTAELYEIPIPAGTIKYKTTAAAKNNSLCVFESDREGLNRNNDLPINIAKTDPGQNSATYFQILSESRLIVGLPQIYYGNAYFSITEAINLGTKAIVRPTGWFRELPEGTAVTRKDNTISLEDFIRDNDDAIKDTNILETFEKEHNYATYSAKFAEIINKFYE